jgi:hypothetical protein
MELFYTRELEFVVAAQSDLRLPVELALAILTSGRRPSPLKSPA